PAGGHRLAQRPQALLRQCPAMLGRRRPRQPAHPRARRPPTAGRRRRLARLGCAPDARSKWPRVFARLKMERAMYYGEQTSNAIPNPTSKVVVVPIGSLEQHGHPLPLLTDSLIGGEITRRAEAEVGDLALFLPMLWAGASDHHLGLPGAVSISNDH